MAQLILNSGGGSDGGNGLSAYEVAVNNGFEGTEEEWLVSLNGKKGDKGDAFKYSDFTTDQLNALKVKGDKGDAFKYSDFTPAQLTALKGAKGDPGFGTQAQYDDIINRLKALEEASAGGAE